jgi:hypothetical protein
MKKNYAFYLIVSLLLLVPVLSLGQTHELIVPPATGPGMYLNATIVGDTNTNGTRKDADRVYVLQRDGQYYVNAVIINSYPVRIKAATGTGKKPIVYLLPMATTGLPPGYFLNAKGDVIISGIIMSGVFENANPADTTNYVAGMQGALINTNSTGLNVTLDDCILMNTNGNHLRTDQAPKTVRISNCTFANMGYLGRSNLGAGKAIDVRGGSVDSLILINNTFINYQDRVIRHYGATAPIKYLRFEHNTMVNGMSYHGCLSLGYVKNQVIISNNLFYDAFALGNDTDYVRQVEFADSKEKDVYGNPRMVWVITSPNDTVQYTIKGNYYAISSSGQNFLTTNKLTEGDKLTWFTNKKLGTDSTKAFTKSSLTLTNIPKLMLSMMNWYRTPLPNGPQKSKLTTMWTAQYDYDRRLSTYFRDTMNCAYATGDAAYTGGSDGFPAGDLNWFPTKKAAWVLTSVDDKSEKIIPLTYSLDQNYPNPFNPSTTITYSLPKESLVSMIIYNALGQEVTKIISDQKQVTGKYNVEWNGKDSKGNTVSTGMYFYKLMTEGMSITKKMFLLK